MEDGLVIFPGNVETFTGNPNEKFIDNVIDSQLYNLGMRMADDHKMPEDSTTIFYLK